jgi:hypothetical protein
MCTHFRVLFKNKTFARREERREKTDVWGTGEFNRTREAWPFGTLKREGISLLQTWQNGAGLASNGERWWGPPNSWSLTMLDLEMGDYLSNFPDVPRNFTEICGLQRFFFLSIDRISPRFLYTFRKHFRKSVNFGWQFLRMCWKN